MNKELENLCSSLEELARAAENKSHDELASLAKNLVVKIKSSNLNSDDKEFLEIIDSIPQKIEKLKNTLSRSYGRDTDGTLKYLITLNWISSVLEPQLSWVINRDPKSMPPAISRRLKSLQAKVDQIDVDHEKLNKQIQLINDATETAESLPADLEDLKTARKKVDSISQEALKNSTKISTSKEEVDILLKDIRVNKTEADKLVDNCEEAYRITTSKGLAGAFDQRAMQLTRSMWVWVFGLLCSLGAAWYVGAERIETLTGALSDPDFKWGMVFTHFLLAIVSLGAPLWFAWLSTKQIGQRFKLAEDYGFKASVAKAYEGYRKEAARIDKELEARLFESALTRVEEAPLRFVDQASHGTPWHELVESGGFKEALKNIPEFRNRIFKLAESALNKVKKKKNAGVKRDIQKQPAES